MPTWGQGQNGKDSEPRNVGKLFKKNYDDINWGKNKKTNKPKIIGYKCNRCGDFVEYPKKYGNVMCKCGAIFLDNIGEGLVRTCLDPTKCEVYESV